MIKYPIFSLIALWCHSFSNSLFSCCMPNTNSIEEIRFTNFNQDDIDE